MFRRPHFVALTVVTLVALVTLSLPTSTTDQAKLALGGLFLPLFGLASSAETLADNAIGVLLPRRQILNELEQLRAENQELKLQLAQAAEVRKENQKLYQALAWKQQAPGTNKLARVILRDPTTWWRSIQIDLGRSDGLRPDLPVRTAEGLVGRVRTVGANSSEVVLIGDTSCPVSALIEGSGVSGIVVPGAETILDPSSVRLTLIQDTTRQIAPESRVSTSGLGGVFPKGVPIGRVEGLASPVDFGMLREVRIKLFADLRTLEEVWVMFP